MSSSVAISRSRRHPEAPVPLRFSLRVASLLDAADLAADLRARTAAESVRVRRVLGAEVTGGWVVVLVTPPLRVTAALIKQWEDDVLAAGQRWPACELLGWRTEPESAASPGRLGKPPACDAAPEARLRAQRDLVRASLLRCASDQEPQGVRTAARPR